MNALRQVEARSLVDAVLAACEPGALVRAHWGHVGVGADRAVRVVAIGKASVAMAHAVVGLLGGSCAGGVVVCVPEHVEETRAKALIDAGLEVLPADHPTPGERNLEAARRVEAYVQGIGPNETLLALISGGGSAHVTLPAEGLTLADVAGVSSSLIKRGATIREINTVRKHVERLKGGRLAAMCSAKRTVVLVLSDVIGDPLDVIASGPLAPDPTTYADALRVMESRLPDGGSPKVRRHLERGARGELEETPKAGHPCFENVRHSVIGSNATAIDAAVAWCGTRGIQVEKVLRAVEGESAEAGEKVAGMLRRLVTTGRSAIVLGGEPTVNVGGESGVGGPSQEMVLAAAKGIAGLETARVIAFSTDGRDGPTDAAGAVVDGGTWDEIAASGIDPEAALRKHDSHTALDRVGVLIRTGPTGTNVNHVAVAMRE